MAPEDDGIVKGPFDAAATPDPAPGKPEGYICPKCLGGNRVDPTRGVVIECTCPKQCPECGADDPKDNVLEEVDIGVGTQKRYCHDPFHASPRELTRDEKTLLKLTADAGERLEKQRAKLAAMPPAERAAVVEALREADWNGALGLADGLSDEELTAAGYQLRGAAATSEELAAAAGELVADRESRAEATADGMDPDSNPPPYSIEKCARKSGHDWRGSTAGSYVQREVCTICSVKRWRWPEANGDTPWTPGDPPPQAPARRLGIGDKLVLEEGEEYVPDPDDVPRDITGDQPTVVRRVGNRRIIPDP